MTILGFKQNIYVTPTWLTTMLQNVSQVSHYIIPFSHFKEQSLKFRKIKIETKLRFHESNQAGHNIVTLECSPFIPSICLNAMYITASLNLAIEPEP